MVRFVEANHPDAEHAVVAPAVDQLLHATHEAMELLSPFTEALGELALHSLSGCGAYGLAPASNMESHGAALALH